MKARRAAAAVLLVGFWLFGCATPHLDARCRPDLPCWPAPADWKAFAAHLTGRLEQPQSPLLPCRTDFAGQACGEALKKLKNPYALQDDPGATESLGMMGAWTSTPSAYAVAAENSEDVAAAVNFARDHHLKLVIKGTGHDYLGRSSAPNSLLVWTHNMRRITVHEAFVGAGCPATQVGIPAATFGAGTRWLEAYQEIAGKHRRYVQGGGCTSVGVAGGFIQGGGFGSWSKKYGIGAAGMLEAQIVTADGQLRVANACQNQDLFWALRGGGGGTFGVVTQVTLMTHPAPERVGFVLGTLTAKDDAAFHELLERFVDFYRQGLFNENWGEQVTVRGDNTLRVSMSFVGMSAAEAKKVWQPFLSSLNQQPERFTTEEHYLEVPGDKLWSADFAQEHLAFAIEPDTRPGQPGEMFWWKTNQSEVATYWYAYQSRWIPADLFGPEKEKAWAQTLFDASRHWPLELHFNKGQAGASAEAVRRDKETSMNPAVYNAAALLIAAATGSGSPEVPGHQPNLVEGEGEKARLSAAMKIIREATPNAGSYVNETDYFEPDWQRTFWGENYDRLLSIKRKYDPAGLFSCHHCVGSEGSAGH